MPTYSLAQRFRRDLARLAPDQRAAFERAVAHFVKDMSSGRFRPGLRVKGIQGAAGIFEMSWAPDGRATFEYGPQKRAGEPHVIWRRVGTHQIFTDP